MKIPHYKKVHNRFRLNGFSCSRQDLKEIAYSFVKEGVDYERVIGDFLLDWLDENDTLPVTTSGTTGRPKQIRVSKQAMVHSAVRTAEFFDLPAGGAALLCLPVDFIAGKMMLVRAIVLGLELDLTPPTLHPEFPKDKNYEFVAMIPQQVENTIDQISQINVLLIGGAAMSKNLRKKLIPHGGCYETYGMTETLTHIAVAPVQEPPAPFRTLEGVRVSQDSTGCLCIDAPHVLDQPIQTQDLVNCLDDQTFYFLGRKDFVINSGGRKLHPERIEQQLSGQIELPFFITKKADQTFGEVPVLVVEDPSNSVSAAVLKTLVGLDKYEMPKEIYTLPEFIKTPNGKIKREVNASRLDL